MPEIWREVPGWPRYEVSDTGRVRSWNNRNGGGSGRILSFNITRTGYATVQLSDGPRRKHGRVHQLVCEAFHGPKPSIVHEPAHSDGDRLNNAAKNLRWATKVENAEDRDRHGHTARGEKNGGGGKLSARDVLEIKRRIRLCESNLKISRDFGVSDVMVYRIAKGLAWRHVRPVET